MATSSLPHSQKGGATPRAGSISCSLPQSAARWAAVAAGPERPAAARSPRTPPHAVPYPQWVRLEKRAREASSTGSTPSTFAAAWAGAELAGRSRNFISRVLDTVITAVPATPANSPLPTAAATSPSLVPTSYLFRVVTLIVGAFRTTLSPTFSPKEPRSCSPGESARDPRGHAFSRRLGDTAARGCERHGRV